MESARLEVFDQEKQQRINTARGDWAIPSLAPGPVLRGIDQVEVIKAQETLANLDESFMREEAKLEACLPANEGLRFLLFQLQVLTMLPAQAMTS